MRIINEVTKLVIGLAIGVSVTNIFATDNVILIIAAIVVDIAAVLWLYYRPGKPTFCETVGALLLGLLPVFSRTQTITIFYCVLICAYVIVVYVCREYKRKCKREVKGTNVGSNKHLPDGQEMAPKQMKSMKASPQSASDAQGCTTSQYSQQLQTKQTTQKSTQNTQDSTFKTNQEQYMSHNSQDEVQYDVGVDALNQFVQGLK